MSTLDTAVMTTQEVANRFYELCLDNKMMEVQEELYAQNAASIEPPNVPGLKSVKGLEAIRQKGVEFNDSVEDMHGGYTGKPIVAGNFFAVSMGIDATMKGMGRTKMDEIAVYEVRDGKIVKEQFFF